MSTTKLREDTLSDITGGKRRNSLQALWTHHPAQMNALKDMCSEYANCVRNWNKQRPLQALPLGNKGLLNVKKHMNILNRSLPAGKNALGALLQFHETQMELSLVVEELWCICQELFTSFTGMRTAMNEGNFGTPMNEAKKKIADSKNLLFEQVKYQKATEKDTNQAEGKLRKVIHSLQPFTHQRFKAAIAQKQFLPEVGLGVDEEKRLLHKVLVHYLDSGPTASASVVGIIGDLSERLGNELKDKPVHSSLLVVRKLGSSGFILVASQTRVAPDEYSAHFSNIYYGNSPANGSVYFQLYYQPDKVYETGEIYIRPYLAANESKDLGFVEEISEFVIAATCNRRCIHPIRSDYTRTVLNAIKERCKSARSVSRKQPPNEDVSLRKCDDVLKFGCREHVLDITCD